MDEPDFGDSTFAYKQLRRERERKKLFLKDTCSFHEMTEENVRLT